MPDRHGWAGLVCFPAGACWRPHGRPTRQATSSGWARTAGAPRSRLCCTWRRWPRVLSLSSPRGCPCEVGPAGLVACPPRHLPPRSMSSLTVPPYGSPTPSLSHSCRHLLSPFFRGPQPPCADVPGWPRWPHSTQQRGDPASGFPSPQMFLGVGGMWHTQNAIYQGLAFVPVYSVPPGAEQGPRPAWGTSAGRAGSCSGATRGGCWAGAGISLQNLPGAGRPWEVLGLGLPCSASLLGTEPTVTWAGADCSG